MRPEQAFDKERCWHLNGLGIVRVEVATSYEPCFNGGSPRTYFKRIPNDAPGRMGRRTLTTCPRTDGAWYLALPLNEWAEVIFPSDQVGIAGPKGVLP